MTDEQSIVDSFSSKEKVAISLICYESRVSLFAKVAYAEWKDAGCTKLFCYDVARSIVKRVDAELTLELKNQAAKFTVKEYGRVKVADEPDANGIVS